MDIFTKIEKRGPAKKAPKRVRRYFVCVGSAAQMRSRRLYSYTAARRLVARAKRLGLDAYMSGPVMLTIWA